MMRLEQVVEEALHLSPIDRVKLLDLLLSSFNHQKTIAHEQSWAIYAEQICDEVDAGAKLYDLDAVVKTLNQ